MDGWNLTGRTSTQTCSQIKKTYKNSRCSHSVKTSKPETLDYCSEFSSHKAKTYFIPTMLIREACPLTTLLSWNIHILLISCMWWNLTVQRQTIRWIVSDLHSVYLPWDGPIFHPGSLLYLLLPRMNSKQTSILSCRSGLINNRRDNLQKIFMWKIYPHA